jgi:clan AA aspartic protease
MGLTYVDVHIANPLRPKRRIRLSFLVDSGAFYSVVPASVLRKLGVKPRSRRAFTLADGSQVTRRMGEALFRFNGHEGTSPVIFGQKDDSILFGVISLEVLGFFLDPLKRELRPLPMLLAPQPPRRRAGR